MPTTAPRPLTDPLDRFEREYQRYNGQTEEHILRQQRTLREFSAFAGKDLLDCGSGDLRGWLSSLTEDRHPNTVRKKANEVRPFYSWAYSANLIDGEKLMSIRSVENPKGSASKSTPKPYSSKELKLWRKELNDRLPFHTEFKLGYWRTGRAKFRRVADHFQRVQLDAIVGLALHCGLRRSEIRALSIDDMHPENAYVVVREGKGGKHREVPHTKRSRELVGTWLEHREELAPGHEDPWLSLAPNQPDGGWLRPMGEKRYSKLLLGIGDWQLHRFRHTCATNWLRAGMPIDKVQKLLGHATIEQTLSYAELVREDLQRAVEEHEEGFDQQVNGD